MTDLNAPENPNSPSSRNSHGGKISNVPLPLKIAVYGMGLALIVMLLLVGSRFMDRRAENRTAAATQGVPWEIDLGLIDLGLIDLGPVDRESADPGMSAISNIKSAVIEGRTLTVVVGGPSGDQVILIDVRKGEVVGKVRLVTP